MLKHLFFLLLAALVLPSSIQFSKAATYGAETVIPALTGTKVINAKPHEKKKRGLFTTWKQKLLAKAIQKGWLGEGEVTEKQKRQGRLSMIFGLGGLVLLFVPGINFLAIPAAIVALVLGIKSVEGNSNTNGIIGIIAGGLTLVLLILAIAVLVAFFASWN